MAGNTILQVRAATNLPSQVLMAVRGGMYDGAVRRATKVRNEGKKPAKKPEEAAPVAAVAGEPKSGQEDLDESFITDEERSWMLSIVG